MRHLNSQPQAQAQQALLPPTMLLEAAPNERAKMAQTAGIPRRCAHYASLCCAVPLAGHPPTCSLQSQRVPALLNVRVWGLPLTQKRWAVTQNSAQLLSSNP